MPASPAPRTGEFVALIATLMSLVALSIDGMLPALPAIGADLDVARANDTQLVVSTLLIGVGLGQLVYGPLSDSFGRKLPIYAGLGLFMLGCALSILAPSFEWMLAGRLLQGFGASAPRIVVMALVRDQFAGREMARIMSFAMSVFIVVPALAPALGQGILLVSGWRAIFATFLCIAAAALAWFAVRQPETLPRERRRPFSLTRIAGAVREIFTTRAAIGHTLAAGLVFSPFIAYLSTAQQIFQDVYDAGTRFPLYFALLALGIGTASIVNARLVMRIGMRRLSTWSSGTLTVLAAGFWTFAFALDGAPPLWSFLACFTASFFCIGMLFGNLNALAMEPLGHIAGVGAAVVGATATIISVPIGALVGQQFDGTVLPLAGSFAVFAAATLATIRWAGRGTAAAGAA